MDLRNQLIKKVEPRINSYLKAYKIPSEKLTLAEKTREIAKNIMKLSYAFEAKLPAFKKVRGTEKYYDAFENYLDQDESDRGFEGFDNGDQNYEDQHFLPIVAGLGAKLAKKGLQAVAKKAKGFIQKKLGVGQPAPAEPAPEAQAPSQAVLHEKIRTNVIDAGVDVWLTDKKKKQIDKLIGEANKKKFSNEIKATLINLGFSPSKFKNYMDETGDFSGENAQKMEAILKEILMGEEKQTTVKPIVDSGNKTAGIILGVVLVGSLAYAIFK